MTKLPPLTDELSCDPRIRGDMVAAIRSYARLAVAEALEQEDKWLPIESAPKDGTYFLASTAGGGVWVAHWFPVAVSGYRFEQPWRSVMLNHYHIPEQDRYLTPTHWIPLPAPPIRAMKESA